MYTMATCTCTIFRGTTVDEFGDLQPANIPVAIGVLAAIKESSVTVQDFATQTPRAVRAPTAYLPYGTDVQVGDRIQDDRYQVSYWVVSTTIDHAPGHQPDISCELKRVQ